MNWTKEQLDAINKTGTNIIVSAGAGSGKTSAVVDPLVYSLAKAGESMVFTDPKGEIYRNHTTYLKHKGYKRGFLFYQNTRLICRYLMLD